MSITNNEKYFIRLLCDALDGKKAVPPSQPVDLARVVALARKHNTANLVGYALVDAQGVPDPVRDNLKGAMSGAIYKEAIHQAELSNVFKRFEREKIKCAPLKGTIAKRYYPSPDMRVMGDIDLLCDPKRMDEAASILCEMGYAEIEGEVSENHRVYRKAGIIMLELHNHPVSKKYEFSSFFDNAFDRLIPDESEYICRQTDEDYYIFHIVHLIKHYTVAGIGIRALLDIYTFLKARGEGLDREYVDSFLDKMGFLKFARNIEELTRILFEERTDPAGLYEKMAEYILSCGVQGTAENRLVAQSDNFKKSSHVISRIFPPLSFMRRRFPVLRRAAVLLPLFWIWRLLLTLFSRREAVSREIAVSSAVSDSAAAERKRMLIESGLKASYIDKENSENEEKN